MIEALCDAKRCVVGLKQTLRALQQDRVAEVYLADDIDEHIRRKIITACGEHDVSCESAGMNQKELGAKCRIEVGAAVLSILKPDL